MLAFEMPRPRGAPARNAVQAAVKGANSLALAAAGGPLYGPINTTQQPITRKNKPAHSDPCGKRRPTCTR